MPWPGERARRIVPSDRVRTRPAQPPGCALQGVEEAVVAARLQMAGVLDGARGVLDADGVRGREHVHLRAVEPQTGVVQRVLGPVEEDVRVGVGGVLHGRLHETAGGQLEDELLAVGEVDPAGELRHPERHRLSVGRSGDRRVGRRGRRVAAGGPGVERAVRVGPALLTGREQGPDVVDVDLVAAPGVVPELERDGGGHGGFGAGRHRARDRESGGDGRGGDQGHQHRAQLPYRPYPPRFLNLPNRPNFPCGKHARPPRVACLRALSGCSRERSTSRSRPRPIVAVVRGLSGRGGGWGRGRGR